MNDNLKALQEALNQLNDSIVKARASDALLTETYGIGYPALYPADLEDMPKFASNKIQRIGNITLSDYEINETQYLVTKIKKMESLFVPNFYNGNGTQAIPSFISSFVYINQFLDSLASFERLDSVNLIPRTLSRKIRSIDARINQLEPGIDNIEEKIKLIENAYTAAENIPIDLEELRKYNTEAENLKQQINKILFSLEHTESESAKELGKMVENGEKAEHYLSLCEKAIRASTSKGLAGAFEIKARNLNVSIILWIVGLLFALGAGGWLGFERLNILSKTLEQPNPSTTIIITQLLLSIFSIGAPLWFAWISTKQINQRFKLAEDYAFKAAVAKAYEGYKNEASRVSDGEFEKRLFDSALTRLEEAPLRLLNENEHATPWAELLNSKSFHKFLDASIDNVNFVKGIISKKNIQIMSASNDPLNPEKKDEIKKVDA